MTNGVLARISAWTAYANLGQLLAVVMSPSLCSNGRGSLWTPNTGEDAKGQLSNNHPKRETMSVEWATITNMWEIRTTWWSNGFPTTIIKLKSAPKALRMPGGCHWLLYGNHWETKNCSRQCWVNQLKSARVVKRQIVLPSGWQSDGSTRIVNSNRSSF